MADQFLSVFCKKKCMYVDGGGGWMNTEGRNISTKKKTLVIKIKQFALNHPAIKNFPLWKTRIFGVELNIS